MSDFNYALDESRYTWQNALLWGNFTGHCKKATQGNWRNRIVHTLIAGAEFLPIISQIASTFEKLIVNPKPQNLSDSQRIPPQQDPRLLAKASSASKRLQRSFENETPEKWQKRFNEFLLNPQDFTGIEGGENYLIGTPFSECHCFSRNHRQEIEKIIVDGIDKRIENKSGTLRLASFGAGGLLQDLIILGKLILKGFKNITIDFVDLLPPNQERAKKLEEMLNKLPGVTINTCCISRIEPEKMYDIIHSIDFTDINISNGSGWQAIFNAKQSLLENGQFYLFGAGKFIQLILNEDNHFTDLRNDVEASVEGLCSNTQFLSLHHVPKIHIVVTRANCSANFDLPHIAKILQLLAKEFDKPIHVSLYGNEDIRVPDSAYRLTGSANEKVLQTLSGIDQLSVQYYKEDFSEAQHQTAPQIFIKNPFAESLTVEFTS
ncbi:MULTISPECIES: hypothetical protein [Parachlamydia]|uniref:Uncharacterized protein n=2 Tax=Parachlamydia acanthamoebae TaxID=83552 RepID=F8L2C6_PARAV|nr:hypothetical protein [Parachlamydia acanthamoebae]KIA76933.1 hypothetical protein DB43_HD00590 [Parachlamydia acanthamoebae]CCB87439.1 putative uncharacterized protein [Parachlamydia acanthamoebae UV-7]